MKAKLRIGPTDQLGLDRFEFIEPQLESVLINPAFGACERDIVFEVPRLRSQQP